MTRVGPELRPPAAERLSRLKARRFQLWSTAKGLQQPSEVGAVQQVVAMLIESMTRETSIDLLKRARVARLGYIHDGQPYIVPMLFAYDGDYLYAFSTEGQKIAGMRANPQVCVEVDDLVTTQQWETVIVLGRYEELPHTEEHETSRAHAYALLQRRPAWWEPGYVKTIVDGKARPLESLYFRVRIDQISGRRGLPG